jgi:putative endonuclease
MTDWYCYILRCIDEGHKNLTYNGSTNNLNRRLRQHNCEISGGAKATHGKSWEYYMLLTGFVNHSNALSCEWKIKKPTGQKYRPSKYCGVAGRIRGMNIVLPLKIWTSKCKILNNDCKYTLYIVEDIIEHLDKTTIPDNIEVIVVNKINYLKIN